MPHMRLDALDRAHLALARVPEGVHFEGETDSLGKKLEEPTRAVFFLVGPEADPGRHLRILAQIARRVDQESFMPEWLGAESDEHLKEALFRNERVFVMTLKSDGKDADLIGLRLSEVSLPDGTLIAMIRRGDEMIIPKGDTALVEGDRLTVIGRSEGIQGLRERYGGAKP